MKKAYTIQVEVRCTEAEANEICMRLFRSNLAGYFGGTSSFGNITLSEPDKDPGEGKWGWTTPRVPQPHKDEFEDSSG